MRVPAHGVVDAPDFHSGSCREGAPIGKLNKIRYFLSNCGVTRALSGSPGDAPGTQIISLGGCGSPTCEKLASALANGGTAYSPPPAPSERRHGSLARSRQ